MTATDDVRAEADLFRSLFGCTDGPWHDEARRTGRIVGNGYEWRRESDGRWRVGLSIPPTRETSGKMNERRAQVVKQLEAVAHLATALANVSSDLAKAYADPDCRSLDALVEMTGDRTARQMEALGDILNGMDAVTEEDDHLTPVFEAAHKMWPQTVAAE